MKNTPYVSSITLRKDGLPRRMTVRRGRATFIFVWREVAGGDWVRFTLKGYGDGLGDAAVCADAMARTLLDVP